MRHISFIRGINVGKAKRVAMVELRALAGELGYLNVRTLRNSGNLIFDTTPTKGRSASRKIEKELSSRLDVAAHVITITEAELDGVVEKNPFENIATDLSRFLVAILENPQDRALLASITEQDWTPEIIELDERAAYLWCPGGVLASPLVKALTIILGKKMTTRNWATILKIHTLAQKPLKNEAAT